MKLPAHGLTFIIW